MTELEDLIEEQDRERHAGSRQYREPFVAFSLDQIAATRSQSGHIPLIDFVQDEGTLRLPSQSKTRPWGGCPLHGRSTMRLKPSGKPYCRQCNIDNLLAKRRARGVKPRNWCPHEGEFLRVTKKGHRYCGECLRRRNAARYQNTGPGSVA
jgi:hypothetical protein